LGVDFGVSEVGSKDGGFVDLVELFAHGPAAGVIQAGVCLAILRSADTATCAGREHRPDVELLLVCRGALEPASLDAISTTDSARSI
jgi:hypothetical protein